MSYQELRQNISRIDRELSSLISKAKLLPFVKEAQFEDWERICAEIKDQIPEDIFHIAVVGTIKSGKSTLVNYLFQGDYLKRGAGIVTSFITKARKGNALRAILKLKSCEEVNTEIERAINGISLYEPGFREMLPFDIRNGQQTGKLSQMIKGLDLNMLLKNGSQDIHYLTLSLYMKGYDFLKEIISDKETTLIYKEKDFEQHKRFVANDSLAIYLKDIVIEINNGIFDESVEIADCQGSDSPNPMHMLMVQEYLLGTQLIIYVISSRMGVREADIRFLHTIKKMGMIDDVIFAINFDLDEHKSIQDLLGLWDSTRDQLSLFVPDPPVFTFSALFNLLNEMEEDRNVELSDRERSRLYQWRKEKDFVELSDEETKRFLSHLNKILYDQRYSILIKSWLERLYMVSSDMKDWLSLNIEMVSGDKTHSKELIQRLRGHKVRLEKTRLLLKDTLEGSSKKLKENIRREIDHFFDRNGELLTSLKQFVTQFRLSHDRYMDILQESSVSHAQYIVFMEYKRSLDQFIVQSINPLIIKLLKEVDKKIKDGFHSILDPYNEILWDVISESSSNKTNIPYSKEIINLEHVKKRHNITPPSIVAALEYNILLSTETIMRFGIYRFFNLLKKAIKKRNEDAIDEKVRALEHGLSKIKRQALDSLIFNLTNYKENLKYQYAFSLIDACGEYVINIIDVQLKNGLDRFFNMEEEMEREQFDKESLLNELKDMRDGVKDIISYIEKLGDSGSFIHLLK